MIPTIKFEDLSPLEQERIRQILKDKKYWYLDRIGDKYGR